MKNNELTLDIITLMVQITAILPESKVNGTDMFGRKDNNRPTMLDLLQTKLDELKSLEGEDFPKALENIQAVVDDKVQMVLDYEDDLHRNEEVDDVHFRYMQAEMTARGDGDTGEQGWEYTEARAEVARVYSVADDAVLRNYRMAVRLAVVAKLQPQDQELLSKVNDSLVEELIMGMENQKKGIKLSDELKPFEVTTQQIKNQLSIINKKDNASFFRRELEKKAEILRQMSIICEEMMGRQTHKKRPMDVSFIRTTINVAKRLQAWCKRYFEGGKSLRSMRRYSYAAMAALYNECLDVLHLLGVYNETFYRTDKATGEVYSFFMKKTQEDMVQVKSGLNWADELRTGYYETDDGTGRTAVRGSGD